MRLLRLAHLTTTVQLVLVLLPVVVFLVVFVGIVVVLM